MKPNIFQFATSELSQDAFLAWLLQWADIKFKVADVDLHNAAQDFLIQLLGDNIDHSYNINTVDSGNQWLDIDVYAEINNEILLIIEDKTGTNEHSNQLARYKTLAQEWCNQNNYKKLVCIYLKTGVESKTVLQRIEEISGFKVFPRKNFLNFLQAHPNVTNNIFNDFRDHLVLLEESYNDFNHTLVKHWEGKEWKGFYQHLEEKISLTWWGYVNNPSGGFWCAVLIWPMWKGFPVHMQLEQRRLCFKISFDKNEIDIEESEYDKNTSQDEWQQIVLSAAKRQGITEITRPRSYVHRGTNRTVAIVSEQDWLGNGETMIDLESVVARLNKYKSFIKEVAKEQMPVES
jgi:hypothetical protein